MKEKSLDIGGYEEDDVFDPFTSSSPENAHKTLQKRGLQAFKR